jgi:hypothetical protein
MAVAASAEMGEKTGLLEHQGIIDANILCERQYIEHEARQLIINRDIIAQPAVQFQEYQDNGRTVLMEALTESGHLSAVRLSGTLEEIESQMLGRLLNGWNKNLPQHEKDRRFAEICNVLYGREVRAALVAGKLPENTAILEVSDYPKPLAGMKLGYRDKNEKGMLRSTHLVNKGAGQFELVIEQLSRSNSADYSTRSFFGACNLELASNKPSDLAALEKPVLYSLNDYADGVIDIQRLLDKHAGSNTLYGDTGAAKVKHVPYEDLREESQRREAEIVCFTDDLAKLEQQLDGYVERGQMTPKERIDNLYGEINRILAAICTLEPNYAVATYGEKAAPAFEAAAIAVARGNPALAQRILSDTIHLREEVSFCGGSISVEKADELGLEVNSYSKLVKKGRESWKWKKGVCVVKTCETRPGETKVGPCSVCEKCQAKFDDGDDPTKSSPKPKIPRTRGESYSMRSQETNVHVGRTALKPHNNRRRGDHHE